MSQTWDDTLRASGFRVTPQRQLVLEAVTKLEHATPEEIFGDIHQRARGVNVSTVYRTLEVLEKVGLVTHTHLGHGAPRSPLGAPANSPRATVNRRGLGPVPLRYRITLPRATKS